jgi:exonuclease SbcD
MRVIHSSDWHLGHMLRGEVTREREHAAFLRWLADTCVSEAADVLLVTGDVFDSATPPASAERMWFELLAALRRALPRLDIVAIAGNHDSPARLGAPAAILRELGVHVIGALPRTAAGGLDLDRILVPVCGGRGLVAAVPFVRPSDVAVDVEDPLGAIYGEVIAEARVRRGPDQALIVMGHLYVAGADAEYLSERRVTIGGQESAPLRLFPDDVDYVALGHIHRSQRVGRDTIRYAGAPIALALDEARYRHQVLVIDFETQREARSGSRADEGASPASGAGTDRAAGGSRTHVADDACGLALAGTLCSRAGLHAEGDVAAEAVIDPDGPDARSVVTIRGISVPRTVEIRRVPARGAAPLAEVERALAALPSSGAGDRPYLEVVVALDRPEPHLRARVEAAVAGKHARLVYLHVELTGDHAALADRVVARRLAELDPREVFERLWARDHAQPPAPEVLAAFERLLAEVQS